MCCNLITANGSCHLFIHLQWKDVNFRHTESQKHSRLDFCCPSLIIIKTVIRRSIASAENAVYGLKAIALNNESAIDPRSLRSQSMLSQKVEPSFHRSEFDVDLWVRAEGEALVTTARKIHDSHGIQGYSVCLLLNFQSVLWGCVPIHILTVLYSMQELQSQLLKTYS